MYRIINVYAIKMAGVFMISLGTIWVRTRVMPCWLAFLTVRPGDRRRPSVRARDGGAMRSTTGDSKAFVAEKRLTAAYVIIAPTAPGGGHTSTAEIPAAEALAGPEEDPKILDRW
jgi:hypothetical protein